MDERVERLRRSWVESPSDRDAFDKWLASARRGTHLFRIRVGESGVFGPPEPNGQGRFEFQHLQTGIRMVEIPAGECFSARDVGRDQRKARTGTSRPYLMSKFPVTQEQWYSVMGTTPWTNRVEAFPVTNVSWEDAHLFCKNTHLILPSEAMWLYALGDSEGTDSPSLWGMVGGPAEWLHGTHRFLRAIPHCVFDLEGFERFRCLEDLIFERHLCVEWRRDVDIVGPPEQTRLVKYGLSLPVQASEMPLLDTDGEESTEEEAVPDNIPNAGVDGVEDISPGDILADYDNAFVVHEDVVRFRMGNGRPGDGTVFPCPTRHKAKDEFTGFRPAWA